MEPVRARSKRRDARSRAAGGREDGSVGGEVVGCAEEVADGCAGVVEEVEGVMP